jgi:K(+)-stimulated pyrophosphate-energized sodium pump
MHVDVSEIIFQTCKTYLIQQGKFLLGLEIIIVSVSFIISACCQRCLSETSACPGRLRGWYPGLLRRGLVRIRMNTLANSRMAFSSLEGKPSRLLDIP